MSLDPELREHLQTIEQLLLALLLQSQGEFGPAKTLTREVEPRVRDGLEGTGRPRRP